MLRAVIIVVLLALLPSHARAETRVALLIGNQSYDLSVGVLKNPHNDIAIVGQALSKQGFEVLPAIKDAKRSAILGGVRELVRRLNGAEAGAIGFVYYSGHGAAEKDTNINYLIPIDAKEPGTLMLPAEKYPVVILINKYSASASEILSAALQDHGRAVVIGERSYGKGSVQNVILMERGTSALKLTTASYWRPSGKNIHRFPDSKETDEWGVKPNAGFEVPLKDEERRDYAIWRNDRDVVRKGGKTPEKELDKDKNKEKKPPFADKVLQKALEHIRGEAKKAAAA